MTVIGSPLAQSIIRTLSGPLGDMTAAQLADIVEDPNAVVVQATVEQALAHLQHAGLVEQGAGGETWRVTPEGRLHAK